MAQSAEMKLSSNEGVTIRHRKSETKREAVLQRARKTALKRWTEQSTSPAERALGAISRVFSSRKKRITGFEINDKTTIR